MGGEVQWVPTQKTIHNERDYLMRDAGFFHALPDETNPHFVLGVAPGCDPATLKRAYLEHVKRFPPETEPEIFRKISNAYRAALSRKTLSADHAFSLANNANLESLVDEALGKLAEEPEAAIAQLRILHRTDPQSPALRFHLALALLQVGRNSEATSILEGLHQEFRQLGRITAWLGLSLLAESNTRALGIQKLYEAQQQDPNDDTPLLMLIDHQVKAQNLAEAHRLIDSSIRDHAKEPARCLPYWLRGFTLAANSGDRDLAQRMLSFVEPLTLSSDRDFAAHVVFELLDLGIDFAAKQQFWAADMLGAAVRKASFEMEAVSEGLALIDSLKRANEPESSGPSCMGCFWIVLLIIWGLSYVLQAMAH